METGELAAVRFTTSGERLGAFSPDDIHGVMDRVGEDGSITATVPASGNLIDPGWRDIKAGILRIDRTELDRFITMNTPAVALPEPVAPAPMPSASPAPSDDLILELRRHREAIERAAHEADQRHTHEQAHAGFARIRAATEAGIKATQATQKPNASPAPAEAPPAPVARPPQRQRHQESEILRVLRELGHDPHALPRNTPGRAGPKAAAFGRLGWKKEERGVFDKAWDRLRQARDIADA